MNRKERLKVFAQQTPAPAAPSTTTPQAATTTTTTTVVSPPPAFNATTVWGWLPEAYNSATLMLINGLLQTLNIALQYSSNGQFNLQILRDNGFQVDPSGTNSPDTKNLMNLCLLVYRTYLNSGNQFQQKVSAKQINGWNTTISNSQALLNLSQINPTGPLAQKVGSTLKDNILNVLRYIAGYNQ